MTDMKKDIEEARKQEFKTHCGIKGTKRISKIEVTYNHNMITCKKCFKIVNDKIKQNTKLEYEVKYITI